MGPYLNDVYNDVVINQGLPDITLLVVYANTQFGLYNSGGEVAQTVKVDPNNSNQVSQYLSDREKVYSQWY